MNAATRITASRPVAALDPWAAQFAAHGVRAAGRILLDLRSQHEEDGDGLTQSLIRTGVTWSTLQLRGHVRQQFPEDEFLTVTSECTPPTPTRRTWVAQPLEGAERFGRFGDPHWSVHLSLWLPEIGLVVAAIALPAMCEVATTSPAVSRSFPAALAPAERGEFRILLADPDAGTAVTASVARLLAAELTVMESPGAMTMAVVRGDADAYLCSGRHFSSLLIPRIAEAAGLVVRPLSHLRLPGIGGNAPEAGAVLICRNGAPWLRRRMAA